MSKAWNERKEGAKGREEKNGSKVTQTERRAKRVKGRKNRDCRKSKPKHQIGSANCKRKQKQEKKHSLTCEAQLFGHIRQELDLFVPI